MSSTPDPNPSPAVPHTDVASMEEVDTKREPSPAIAKIESSFQNHEPEAAPSAVPSLTVTNGTAPVVKTAPDEEDTADEPIVSPPPSSSVSSINPEVLGDEIIVGTGTQAVAANGDKISPVPVVAERVDTEMAEVEEEEPVSHYPKRKRASIYNDLGEDKLESSFPAGADDSSARAGPARRPNLAATKGVQLGYWRDSPVPKEAGRHAVIGFMDIRDRLRTRIQNVTRTGDSINTRLFPIPPGPGGSWVTFERVVFVDHLVGFDHNEVKEYVKIRTEAIDRGGEDSEDAAKKAEIAAADEARRRVRENPPPETAQPPAIAYGVDIPENAHVSHRPDAKRRRTGSAVGTISAGPTVVPQAPPPPPPVEPVSLQPLPDNLPGSRPTRILVGCWSKSSAPRDEDKHAVYGILGANDMFRVKLVRETMDGRFVDGNFPTGAGALWIAYEEVKFLPHIRDLNRPEMKEYCRVRQAQMDGGETDATRVANETKAVYEAQRRAAANPKALAPGGPASGRNSLNPNEYEDVRDSPKPEPAHELRHSRRDMIQNDGRQNRHSMPEAEIRQASRHPSADALERTNSLARREVQKMEAAQVRQDRHNAQRQAAVNANLANDSRAMFRHNVQGLQGVWQKQEADRMQGIAQQQQQQPQQMQTIGTSSLDGETRWHNGMKYERKLTGPFAGKLVSQGTIISIEGDDYVEYRVLTKPTFF